MANSEDTDEPKQVAVRDLRSLFERKSSSRPSSLRAQASNSVGTSSCTDYDPGRSSDRSTQCARNSTTRSDGCSFESGPWPEESSKEAPSNSKESLRPIIGPKPTRFLKAGQTTRVNDLSASNLSQAEIEGKLSNHEGMQTSELHFDDPSLLPSVARTETEVESVRDTPVIKHRDQSIAQTRSSDSSLLNPPQDAIHRTDNPHQSISRDCQTDGIFTLRRLFDTEDNDEVRQIPTNLLTSKKTSISQNARPSKPTQATQPGKRPAPAIPQRKPDVPARPSATSIPSDNQVVNRAISPAGTSNDKTGKFDGYSKDLQMTIPSHQRASDCDTSEKKVARRTAPSVPTRKSTSTGSNFELDTDIKARYLECFESIADPHSDPRIARPASVRSVWIRSRLPSSYLADIWSTVTDHEDLCKGLTSDQFTAAMRIIDAKLRIHAQFASRTERLPPQLPQRPIES